MTNPQAPIVVAGAGVIGVCCAWELLRRGHEVCLLDPDPPGNGCSAGNAGIIAAESITPLATPGMLLKLPSMLLGAHAPLRLEPLHLPALAPWLLRYLWAARPAQIERSTRALAELAAAAVAAWRDLLEAADLAAELQSGGWLFAYTSDRSFRADAAERARQSAKDIDWRLLTDAQRRRQVPALSPAIKHVVHYPDSAWTPDPQALVQTLARRFQADGGRILAARLSAVELREPDRLLLRTDAETMYAGQLVLCFGADSADWVKRLDRISLPLQAERGYHLQFDRPCPGLDLPVMFGEHKIVATPMRQGLRLAGTAEFVRPGRPADHSRAEDFRQTLAPLLDGLPDTATTRWMGRRPTLPDSLPVLSRSMASPRLWYNFGHQHLGLTLAAVSAIRLADALEERPNSTKPIKDLDIRRFSRH